MMTRTKQRTLCVALCLLFLSSASLHAQIATPANDAKPEENYKLRSLLLDQTTAANLQATLSKLFPHIEFTGDIDSNALYMRCGDADYEQIQEFVERTEQIMQIRQEELRQRDWERKRKVDAEREAQAKLDAEAEKEQVAILNLKYLTPVSALSILNDLELTEEIRATPAGKTLVVRTYSKAALDRTEALLARLDVKDSIVPGDTEINVATNARLTTAEQVRATNITNARPRPKRVGSLAEQRAAFEAQQSYLRKQIELQRLRLAGLEKRLKEREKQAQEYFNRLSQKATSPADSQGNSVLSGATTIDVIPESDVMIIRGKKEDVEAVQNTISKIRDAATADEAPKTPPKSGR